MQVAGHMSSIGLGKKRRKSVVLDDGDGRRGRKQGSQESRQLRVRCS